MKKLHYLLGALTIGAFTLTSCNNDDNNATASISGTYSLKEVNTETQTDFDQDGTAHLNQMQESSCYNNGKIVLNSDGTLTYTVTGILISTADGSVGCKQEYQATGQWQQQSGNDENAVISAVYTDQNGNNTIISLTKTANTLTYEDNNLLSTYPDRNSSGEPVYTSGSTTFVFKK